MSVQEKNVNQNLFSNTSTGNNRQMLEGYGYVKIERDDRGEYFYINRGSKKIYLSDYYEHKAMQVRKNKVQEDITNFFTKQENDFANWRDEYASKIKKWQGKITENKSIYKASLVTIEEKDKGLNPLYKKYNTFDISKFSDGKDKELGYNLYSDKKSAKHASNVALGQISVEQMIIEGYTRLMRHSEFCRNIVAKIAQGCISD